MKKITKSMVLSFVGAVILVLRLFRVSVDVPYVNQIAEVVCAILIMLGIIVAPKNPDDFDDDDV